MDAATRRAVRRRAEDCCEIVVSLFNPRTQSWHEHFEIEDVEIVGLTAIGRATVRLLHMNAEDRLKVRSALRERGELDR